MVQVRRWVNGLGMDETAVQCSVLGCPACLAPSSAMPPRVPVQLPSVHVRRRSQPGANCRCDDRHGIYTWVFVGGFAFPIVGVAGASQVALRQSGRDQSM